MNNKISFFCLLLTLILQACTGTSNSKVIENEVGNRKDSVTCQYLIVGKEVEPEKYKKFHAKLKAKSETWFCDETSNGGITGYDAVDKRGLLYEVRTESDSGVIKNSISRKPGPQ